jgi:hypothetical protein
MKPIEKHELYQNLSGFLKTKGIELKEGSYAHGIQKSCGLLADAINIGQEGFERAKVGIDRKLEQVRQVIHEKTAPKPATPAATAAAPPASPSQTSQTKTPPVKPRARKAAKPRKAHRAS